VSTRRAVVIAEDPDGSWVATLAGESADLRGVGGSFAEAAQDLEELLYEFEPTILKSKIEEERWDSQKHKWPEG